MKEYGFVLVDGYRASLPVPKTAEDLTITREELAVATAVNSGRDEFPRYISRFRVSG
ncbi:MAG: hypothetical protein QM757_08290 [Paludibaculum sp.]